MTSSIHCILRRSLQSLCLIALLLACNKESGGGASSISLLEVAANGIPLSDGAVNVPVNVSLELTFSAALDIPKFEAAFSLMQTGGGAVVPGISYSNASSKAIISVPTLAFDAEYTLQVAATALGKNEELLDKALVIRFKTVDGGIITEMAPCISATNACTQTAVLTNTSGAAFTFDFFSSFPIYLENARWEKLTNAIIVVHGQNRDADNYFDYMMTALRNENLEENTILIAPEFREASSSTALYWSNSGWREGQNTNTANAGISAFSVIDSLIARLADSQHFPVLKNIVLTGHSSGALFAQAYATAGRAEALFPNLNFEYVVANSQYFYYPDDVRYQEGTGQFAAPAGCPDFNHWPLGYINPPPYLSGTPEATVDQQIVGRRVTYLLGTADTATTGTLNTTDCSAVLLGANRFERGEHMFSLLETNYGAVHNSRKVLVPGIGHDAQGMYQSGVFRLLLREIFE